MELGDSLLGVGQVLGRFPGVVTFAVAFPADKVLELALEHATVNDRIDFVFFFALNRDRFRRRWHVDAVVVPGAEPTDVEDRVDFQE